MTDSNQQQCFVISTIGEDGSERRRFADAVLYHIIDPAIEIVRSKRGPTDPGIAYRRGEQILAPGIIMTQVIDSIVQDDVLIAVLFEPNVNVFYELGVAATLGRPVLCLKYTGFDLPYDVQAQRAILFGDEDLGSASGGKAAQDLADSICEMLDEKTGMRFVAPFEGGIMAPPARILARDRFLDVSYEAWARMMLDTEEELWIAGTTLWELLNPKKRCFPFPDHFGAANPDEGHLTDVLRAVYGRGRGVNVLTMDENSPLLKAMLYDGDSPASVAADHLKNVKTEIVNTHRALRIMMQSILEQPSAMQSRKPGSIRITKISNRMLMNRVTLTERAAFVSPIFYGLREINSGPAFQVAPKTNTEKDKRSRGFPNVKYNLYQQVLDDLRIHRAENPSIVIENGRIVGKPAAVPSQRQAILPAWLGRVTRAG